MTTQPDVAEKPDSITRRELNPSACALVLAFLTRDAEAMPHILSRAAGDHDVSLALAVADMAARMLATACGSQAQAVILADDYVQLMVKRYIDQAA